MNGKGKRLRMIVMILSVLLVLSLTPLTASGAEYVQTDWNATAPTDKSSVTNKVYNAINEYKLASNSNLAVIYRFGYGVTLSTEQGTGQWKLTVPEAAAGMLTFYSKESNAGWFKYEISGWGTYIIGDGGGHSESINHIKLGGAPFVPNNPNLDEGEDYTTALFIEKIWTDSLEPTEPGMPIFTVRDSAGKATVIRYDDLIDSQGYPHVIPIAEGSVSITESNSNSWRVQGVTVYKGNSDEEVKTALSRSIDFSAEQNGYYRVVYENDTALGGGFGALIDVIKSVSFDESDWDTVLTMPKEGGRAYYRIVITNNGAISVDVDFSDEFLGIYASLVKDHGEVDSVAKAGLNDNYTIPAGESITLTYDVEIPANGGDSNEIVDNLATIAYDGETEEDIAVVIVEPEAGGSRPQILPEPRLTLIKEVSLASEEDFDKTAGLGTNGGFVEYRIRIENVGTAIADDVKLTDSLFPEMVIGSLTVDPSIIDISGPFAIGVGELVEVRYQVNIAGYADLTGADVETIDNIKWLNNRAEITYTQDGNANQGHDWDEAQVSIPPPTSTGGGNPTDDGDNGGGKKPEEKKAEEKKDEKESEVEVKTRLDEEEESKIEDGVRDNGRFRNPPPEPPLGNTREATQQGTFIEYDSDGVALGEWHWDEDLEEWMFDEYPPPLGALPPTGDDSDRNTAPFFFYALAGVSILLAGCWVVKKVVRINGIKLG